MRTRIWSGLLALFLTCLASCALADTDVLGSPPLGFKACYESLDPGCAIDPLSAPLAREDDLLFSKLVIANAVVNFDLGAYLCEATYPAEIQNGPDGETNYWKSYVAPYRMKRHACANCINFATSKRRALLAKGLPGNALRFAMVHLDGKKANLFHVVLLVYTDRAPADPYVLDILNPLVERWSGIATREHYELRFLQDEHGAWHEFMPTITAPDFN